MKAILFLTCFVTLFTAQIRANNGSYRIDHKDGKAGIVYVDGTSSISNWVLPPEYDSILLSEKFVPTFISETMEPPSKGFYILFKDGKSGLFSAGGTASNKVIFECRYDTIIGSKKYYSQILLQENNKWGVYDLDKSLENITGKDGNWVLSTEWDELELFDDPYLIYVKKNGKSGIYERIHRYWLLEVIYDNISWKSKKYGNEIILASVDGKTGALSYNYHAKQRSRWIIPIGQYENISHTEPRSEFLIVDSAGKLGVWQFVNSSKDNDDQRAWPLTDASFSKMTYDDTKQLLEIKKDNAIGILSASGWIMHPILDKNATVKDYFLFGTNVRAQYIRGSGFEIKCISRPYMSSVKIPDTASYDDFHLNGNILKAIKGKKITAYHVQYKMQDDYNHWGIGEKKLDRLNVIKSELLVAEAEALFTFPWEAGDDEWVKDKFLTYYKKGEIGSWKLNAFTSSYGVEIYCRKEKTLLIDKWEPDFAKEKSKEQWTMLLLSQGGKWGITDPEGNILAPFEHGSYKILNDGMLLLQSPAKGSWRLFSTQTKSIRKFLHNDIERTDFSSRKIIDNLEVLTIDNQLFYLHSGITSSPVINWFTSTSKAKPVVKPFEPPPVGGEVLLQIQHYGLTVRKMSTGVGLYKLNEVIIPPYLNDIYLDKDREGFSSTATLLVLKDKRHKGQFLIDINNVATGFNHKNFIVIGYMNSCESCNGSGGKTGTITRNVDASSQSTLTKKVEYKEGYQPVWDTRTNSYVGVKTYTPVTTYEATTSKQPGSKVTTTGFINCSKCNGRGIMWNVKRYCSIGVNGLEPGEIISELKR